MKGKCCANSGFTLVELLIIVAIIGILVAMVIPMYRDYTMKAFNSAATADLRHFRAAMEARFADDRAYPIY